MESKWISVEEGTPVGEVIAYGYQGCMIIGYVEVDEDCWECYAHNDHEQLDKVTHWMPLPEPPKP